MDSAHKIFKNGSFVIKLGMIVEWVEICHMESFRVIHHHQERRNDVIDVWWRHQQPISRRLYKATYYIFWARMMIILIRVEFWLHEIEFGILWDIYHDFCLQQFPGPQLWSWSRGWVRCKQTRNDIFRYYPTMRVLASQLVSVANSQVGWARHRLTWVTYQH